MYLCKRQYTVGLEKQCNEKWAGKAIYREDQCGQEILCVCLYYAYILRPSCSSVYVLNMYIQYCIGIYYPDVIVRCTRALKL